ncbi:MAG: radical SAM protein [Candidatus Omnitrophica bacterium]|nr:radical SAM protein [Candidatus Omnitrophota bacterium]
MIPKRNLKRFLGKAIKQPGYALKVLKKRVEASLNYKLGVPAKVFPESITLFLTHQCNLRCRMCGQWGDKGVTRKFSVETAKEHLQPEELRRFIDEIADFRPSITLFGGEPLIYPDCTELIRYIKQKKLHCLMITNGSLLEARAEEIVKSGLDELNVSLDGALSLHDEIRGMPGLFDKIMRGLKQVEHYKEKEKKNKPLVNLQCTISKYNYLHLEELLGVAEEAKVDSLTFHNLIFLGNELIQKQKVFDELLSSKSCEWEGFVFNPEIDSDILFEKIEKIRAGRYRFNLDFYPNFSRSALKEYYNNPNYLPSEYSAHCLSPWIVAYVFPDGEVRPCLNFSYSFGNIHKRSFREIWFSDEAIKFRRTLKQNGLFPVCVRCTELYRY